MIMIVECRRVTTGGQKQGDLAELAWKIFETQSSGGIIVSPLPLQKEAQLVARAENIIPFTLNKDCSTTDYVLAFLNKVMVGLSESLPLMEDCVPTVIRAGGNASSDETAE